MPLIAFGVIVVALAKCAAEPASEAFKPQALLSSPDLTNERPLTTLFVQTRSLKCRALPSRKSAIVTTFARGEQVSITEYSGD